MAKKNANQVPLRIAGASKRETRTQFAALPFRRKKSGVEILLISSLDSGRWIIPKGWPMDGMTPAAAAAQEAWEEAGVRGKTYQGCLGLFSYSKWFDQEMSWPCIVAVFAVEVDRLEDQYPEEGQRKRKWLTPKKAAARVEEPELKQIILNFDPKLLR
jgi:8-oxo-dGTP pyrophosphatase MutT (NUDIX family)